MVRRIEARRDRAHHGIAHPRQIFIIGNIAGPNKLDAGLVESSLNELLGEDRGLARRNEDEQRIRSTIACPLQKGSKIWIRQRHFDGLENSSACFGERSREDAGSLST